MEARKSPPRKTSKKLVKTPGATHGLRRIVNVAQGFREAREWEIFQEITMTPAQRQRVAKALKERFYGKNPPDVRAAHSNR
jgi:hypothetical protein